MKILMLCPQFPWRLHSGGRIRNYHLIKGLGKQHELTIISRTYNNKEADIGKVQSYFSELYLVPVAYKHRWLVALQTLLSLKPYGVIRFQSRQFQQKVNQLLLHKRFDVVFYCSEGMSYYLNPSLANQALHVLDQHDIGELMWERFAIRGNWLRRAFAYQNIWKEMCFYKKTRKYLNAVFCVSKQHAEFMKKQTPKSCYVWVVPHGVDVEYFKPTSSWESKKGNIIMFCGSMSVTMNIDAVLQFAERIFSLVKTSIPDAEFWIVGRDPDHRVLRLANLDGITVTGVVEDMRPYYEKAKVSVAPFRYGGGTKLKIFEAMAMGVPIVSTKIGYQGIEAVPGQHILVTNKEKRFAEEVIRLLEDAKLWKKLSNEGKVLVEQKYSWTNIVEKGIAYLERLVDTRPREV